MNDGRHEAEPVTLRGRLLQTADRTWQQVQYRAKAFLAGVGAAVAGEAVVLLTSASFQQQVQDVVPPAYAFLVPPAFGLLVGGITSHVANGPKPDRQDEQAPEDAAA